MSRHPDSPPDRRRLPRRATDRVEDAVDWLLMPAGLVLAAAWCGVRLLTASCNARRWEREWARVDPGRR